MKQNTKIPALLLLLLASACSALARDVEKPNLGKFREQIGVVESVINQNLSQAFPGPFGYLDKARGAYLPGYGMVFTFEVNLNPQPATLGPFGAQQPQQTPAQRVAVIKKNRQSALELTQRVLADFGHTLEIAPDEWVTLVVQGSAAGPQGIERSTLVVRAQKRDIEQFRANGINRAGFLNKIAVVEY
jgi:hypothetical protein